MKKFVIIFALSIFAIGTSASARVAEGGYMDPQKFAYFNSSIASEAAQRSTLETLLSRESVVEIPTAVNNAVMPSSQRGKVKAVPQQNYYDIQSSGW